MKTSVTILSDYGVAKKDEKGFVDGYLLNSMGQPFAIVLINSKITFLPIDILETF